MALTLETQSGNFFHLMKVFQRTQQFCTLVTVTSHFYHVQQKIGIDTLKRLNKFKSTDSYIYMNTFHGIKKCIHCYQHDDLD